MDFSSVKTLLIFFLGTVQKYSKNNLLMKNEILQTLLIILRNISQETFLKVMRPNINNEN